MKSHVFETDPRAIRDGCDVCHRTSIKLLRCSGCHDVAYCGTSCRKAHAKSHRAVCKTTRQWHAYLLEHTLTTYDAYSRVASLYEKMDHDVLELATLVAPVSYLTKRENAATRLFRGLDLEKAAMESSVAYDNRRPLSVAERLLGSTGCTRIRAAALWLADAFATGTVNSSFAWTGSQLAHLLKAVRFAGNAAGPYPNQPDVPLHRVMMTSPLPNYPKGRTPMGPIDLVKMITRDLTSRQRCVYTIVLASGADNDIPITFSPSATSISQSPVTTTTPSSSPISSSSSTTPSQPTVSTFSSSSFSSSSSITSLSLPTSTFPKPTVAPACDTTSTLISTSSLSLLSSPPEVLESKAPLSSIVASAEPASKNLESDSKSVCTDFSFAIVAADSGMDPDNVDLLPERQKEIAECKASWRKCTSDETTREPHILSLVLHGGSGFLVQCYYGRYTLRAWLDFSTDLTAVDTAALPEAPDAARYHAHRPLDQRPRYRGMLAGADVLRLAQDLERMVIDDTPDAQRERFAHITGVRRALTLCSRYYHVGCTRCLI